MYDHHSHLVGLGHGETGCSIHSTNHSMLFPHRVAKFHVFMKVTPSTLSPAIQDLLIDALI